MSVSERTTNDAADHTHGCVTPYHFITTKKLEKFLKVVAAIANPKRVYSIYNTKHIQ